MSAALAMPKSMIRGPSLASSTFEGFRSRCTSPAAWIAPSPSASPAASTRAEATGSGPCSATASASDGPSTYPVTSHGCGPSGSASTTGEVKIPLTCRAAAISRANRPRNSGSPASSARITFTATSRPPGDRPRYTRPMPPLPSRATSRYRPSRTGLPACTASTARTSPRRPAITPDRQA